MVARPGASMPAPFAMPPTVQSPRVTEAVLWTESVVLIATAASSPPSGESSPPAAAMPAVTRSIGSRTPIRPVEHTATSCGSTSTAPAVRSAIRRASTAPACPVQALAPPELRTTADIRPSARARRVQRTGAAWTRLEVKTPAAARDGPRFTTRARSRSPDSLMPAATPQARNPCAAVTLTE